MQRASHFCFFFYLVCVYFSVQVSAQSSPMFPIKQDFKYGLMDVEGGIQTEMVYDNVGPCINRSYYIFSKDGLMGMLDHSGKEIITAQYTYMNHACEELFSVKKNNKWQVINPLNQVILDDVPGKINALGLGFYTYSTLTGIGLLHINDGKIAPAKYSDIQRIDSAFLSLLIAK